MQLIDTKQKASGTVDIKEKIKNQNKMMDEMEKAEEKDREFVEFQLKILLQLRQKNLTFVAEQIAKEQSFLEKIEMAEKSVEQNRIKLENKLKAERKSL